MSNVEKQLTCPVSNKQLPSFIKLQHPVNGEAILLPMDIEQKDLNSAVSYEAEDSDIFICTYPKCGTTWMQTIVWLMVHNGEPIPGKIRHFMPMLEFDGAEFTKKLDNSVFPRIIKTHFYYTWTPSNPRAKYIYVVREAKDAMVSHFYHCRGYPEHYACPDLDFDCLFDLYLQGAMDSGSYFDHVTSWYVKRNEPNVLFLLYEDLKKDIRREVIKIGKFLGYENALLANNEKLMKLVIEGSSIKSMQSQSDKWSLLTRTSGVPVIRKGIVGDWKNHLSEEQAAKLDRRVRETGDATGWANLWNKYKTKE